MRRPNILLISSDQQHFSTLGCLNPDIHTPNLDRLAAEGVLFTRAYCANPTCTPCRASMITGQYPSQHGAWSLGTKLPEAAHTVGQDFAAAGYATALIGKAHFQPLASTAKYPSLEAYPKLHDFDFWRSFHGPFYGFDHVELARNHTDEAHVGQHYALWMEEKGLSNWRDHFRPPTGTRQRRPWAWELPEKFHYNAWIAERSNAVMERHTAEQRPFFLWSSFFDPHPSYLVPEPWDTMYDPDTMKVPSGRPNEHNANPPHFALTQDRAPDFSPWRETGHAVHGFGSHLRDEKQKAKDMAVYYGMVSCMDKYIGIILDKLDDLGQTDSTLVVFTTDHGHLFGQHNLFAKGAFHYEDMLKVPLIVRQPGRVPAGIRSDALQSLVDLSPTLLRASDIPIPPCMTGLDQYDIWRGGNENQRDHVVVENHHEPTSVHVKTFVDSRYKLTVYYNRPYGELFDLENDPGEYTNLWNSQSHQELKQNLVMRLLFAEMGKEPMWMPRVAGA